MLFVAPHFHATALARSGKPRSGSESDPNRKDDPEYIVRLVGLDI